MPNIDAWFPIYPKDYLSNAEIAALPLASQGALVRLWCYAWRSGSLPNDLTDLLRMVQNELTANELQTLLAKFFELNEDGCFVSARQVAERQKAADKYTARVAQTEASRLRILEKRRRNTVTESVTDTVTESVTDTPSPSPSPSPTTTAVGRADAPLKGLNWVSLAVDAYLEHTGGTLNAGKFGRAVKPLVDKLGAERVLAVWRCACKLSKGDTKKLGYFATDFGRWEEEAFPPPVLDADGEYTEYGLRILNEWRDK